MDLLEKKFDETESLQGGVEEIEEALTVSAKNLWDEFKIFYETVYQKKNPLESQSYKKIDYFRLF